MFLKVLYNEHIKARKKLKIHKHFLKINIFKTYWKEKNVLRDIQGFPGGSVVKNLPADEGDRGSVPDPGRFPVPQTNDCVATPEPLLLRPCSATRKTTAMRSPCPTTGE